MLQAIQASRPTPAPAPTPTASTTSSSYAAGWAAPAQLARPPLLSAGGASPARATEGDSIAASTERTKESALLAADVYKDTPAPPAGFRVASDSELAQLNLKPEMLERAGSSFRARVYATGEGENTRYVVAFRGSSSGEDWKNNFQQAAGAGSESYSKALAIGERLARSDASVTVTGHSLGGGLAAAAAIASGREADTFNAAGLSGKTIDAAKAISSAEGQGGGDVAVQAYNVHGEILSKLQDGGDRVLGAIVFGPAGLLLDAPAAYGARHELPNVAPDDKGWIARHNPVDRHMIDWVLAGARAL